VDKKTLSIQELSEVLNIGRTTAYEAVRSGQVPSVKVGRRLLIPIAALDRFLDAEYSAGAASQRDWSLKKSRPIGSK